VKDDVPTACTDGRNTYYGRDYMAKQASNKRKGVILHENLHKAFRHTTVWRHLFKENPNMANMACDYVINLMIMDGDNNFVSLPDGALLDHKYKGLDAGTVYRMIKEEAKGGTVHVKTVGDQEGKDVPVIEIGNGLDEHDWEGAQAMSDQEKEAQAKEVESALRQGSILVGKMGGNVDRNISEMLVPKINWKDALREFVKSVTQGKDQTTWRRLHKRYIASDIIMPSSYDEKVGGIVIGIDTSGSIGTEELTQFLSEVKSICDEVSPEKMDVLYWDTHVASRETYQNNELSNLVESTKPAGGGGTEPACVPKYIHKHDMKGECLLMLTDGYIPDQEPSNWNINMPVLWCVKGNRHFNDGKVIGKVVHVE
jgi:predicted metal-dependent peptidase